MEPGELLFGTAADASQVSAALSNRFGVRASRSLAQQVTILDTSDWRLHGSQLCLRDVRQRRAGSLRLTDRTAVLATAPSPPGHWPRRLTAMPQSPVRDRLMPAVGVRALLPVAQVGVRSLGFDIVDAEQKTRVHVRVDQQRLAGPRPTPLPLRVLVTPLRGYERDARRCAELLLESLPPGPEGLDGATAAVIAAGLHPGEARTPPAQLDPEAAAAASAARALARWFDVMESVREGVLTDIDTEYLHDLRTALRATRTLLKTNADVFAPETLTRFADDFAWLSRTTGRLRDLDVALLQITGQSALDVSGLTLEPAVALLARRRRGALQSVRAAIRSERGDALRRDWRRTLGRYSAAHVGDVAGGGGPTTLEVAAAGTARSYRRIVKAAAAVTPATPAEELHVLRRRCKRLRYLLDSYASIFPSEPQQELLGSLKKLQDCLGDIQDVDVQREQLRELGSRLAARGAPTETLLSLGALRERLLEKDRRAREVLVQRLHRFRSRRVRNCIAALTATVR